METGACRFNSSNGLGPGSTVVLSDTTGGHPWSKGYLRNALMRLSQQYGFTLIRIRGGNDISDAYLANAKVIIFSNGDGDVGGSIPDAAVRTRVENFVQSRGWGVIAIHAACAFIDTWPFMQDVCVQQYHFQNADKTAADLYVVDTTADGIGQGRRNPHTSFLLEGMPNRERIRDGWHTWRGNPRTSHQYNRESKNKVMLLALDEATFRSVAPVYPGEHYAAWTQTMGPADGIAIHFSPGHDDVYTQGSRAYGDTLLWRMLRYAAKDWCRIGAEGCGATSLGRIPSASPGKVAYREGSLSVNLPMPGPYRVTVTDVRGKQVYHGEKRGPGSLQVERLEAGIYLLQVNGHAGGYTERILAK